MLRQIHVYDLDGVLVDTSHRYRNKPDGSIDLDYWFANRYKLDADTLLPLAKQYRADCENPYIYTVVCTARVYDARDVRFINSRIGKPNKLIMRPRGNMENDAILKRRALQRIFNLRQFGRLPKRFWDDNPKNLNACRDLFSQVFHVPSTITETI
jgi:hypothetical protein